jgi:type II secretory pathway pseudopilin PulG
MVDSIRQHEPQTLRGVGLRIPHSPFRTPHSRAGISLLEVLVSMGILTIGLLSIASLLPLGSYQAQKALTEDAKAAIGQNAYREFRTRGMANPYTWMAEAGVKVLRWNSNTNRDEPYDNRFNPGVIIDPWGYAALSGEGYDARVFPMELGASGNTGGGPVLRRITVQSVWPDLSGTGIQMDQAAFRVYEELARNVFVSHDDTIWDKSSNPDGPAISRWETDNPNSPGVYFRREYAGNYSWLATMVPRYPPYGPAATLLNALPTDWRVSIAVFHRRNPKLVLRDDGLYYERQVKLKGNDPSDFASFGLGGGELQIDDTKQPDFRPGEWVLVSGWYDPSGQGQRNAAGTNTMFLWYRVVAADKSDDGNNQTYPTVTLAGPDWAWDLRNPAQCPCRPSHITIIEGCVGVFEKTVRLEGPSMYAQ